MLKKFRVITDHAINGIVKGEEFEAEWPTPWLVRRINSSHIEEVLPAEDESENPDEPEEDVEESVSDDVEESDEE